MHRKSFFRAVIAVAAGSGWLVSIPASQAGAATGPIPLTMDGASAFAVLGHWCGGITQHDFGTQFDPASGYPDGDVYLSTTCSGSGRGGHPTTYTGWASATWDFTGALVSYVTLSGAPTVNPTLSTYDSHGNQLYNQSNAAYLAWAPGFVPAPRVGGVSPSSAPQGTVVSISGTGFTSATAVSFGSTAATGVVVDSDTLITATAPSIRIGTVDVTVSGPGGTSLDNPSDQFTFTLTPRIGSVSPHIGSSDGGTTVTITGVNFKGASYVSFGGLPASFTVVSNHKIVAKSPTYQDPAVVDITVTSQYGTSAATPADQFTYTN